MGNKQPEGDALINVIMKDIEEESMAAAEFNSNTKVLGLSYIRNALYRHIGPIPKCESKDC